MRLAALVLLAGCDRFLQLEPAQVPQDAPIPDTFDAAPTMLVQQAQNGGNAGSITTRLPNLPAANHLLIAIGGCQNGARLPTGAADWTEVDQSVKSPTLYMYVGHPDGTAGSVTLSTANPGDIFLLVTEWDGLDAINPIDAHTANGATGSGAIDLSITASSAPDLLVFAASTFDTVPAPAGGWNSLDDVRTGTAGTFITQKSWYRLEWGPGTVEAKTTHTNDYDAVLAAFRTAP